MTFVKLSLKYAIPCVVTLEALGIPVLHFFKHKKSLPQMADGIKSFQKYVLWGADLPVLLELTWKSMVPNITDIFNIFFNKRYNK